MKNIENAIMMWGPVAGDKLPQTLIGMIIEEMKNCAWRILHPDTYNEFASRSSMHRMREYFEAKCKEYSRILALSGFDTDENWCIKPIFAEDFPIGEGFPIIFPLGVTYHGQAYSFDIEKYAIDGREARAYREMAETLYADKLPTQDPVDALPLLDVFKSTEDEDNE